MTRKCFKRKSDGAIYYEGKDHKNSLNLINMQTGSEMFLPGFYSDEPELIEEWCTEISKTEALSEIPHPTATTIIN